MNNNFYDATQHSIEAYFEIKSTDVLIAMLDYFRRVGGFEDAEALLEEVIAKRTPLP